MDLEYIVLPSRIKENIILQKAQDISHYVVTLFSENLSARLLENKEIEFYNDNNDVVFTMTSPYMYDSVGELSENIQVEMISKGDGCYYIKITPDSQWLNNEHRVYPIVIDPQVSVDSARSNIVDNYVLQGAGNQNRNLDRLYIGQKSNSIARAFIKYDCMPTIPATATITSATMTLTITSGTSTAANASAYKVTGGDWESGTITWANMPAASTAIATNISHNNLSRYSFSCKTAVQSWYSGSATGNNANYGIMLRYYDESIDDYNAVYSADYTTESKRPSLTISYTGAVDTSKTFAAFDVGNSSQDEVSFVADWMEDFGYRSNGLYNNADATVSASVIKTVGRNSEVVYINSHGGQATNIKVYDNDLILRSYLCADETITIPANDDIAPKVAIGAQFKSGSSTKTTSYWNNGTKWVILAPCSQLDHNGAGLGNHWNGLTSAETWARTMLGDGKRIHGYVGFYDGAPGGDIHLSKLDNFFNFCMYNNYTIVDAWAMAHTSLIGSCGWAAIYHSANTNDRFQSMSAATANGSPYEIYYVSRHTNESEIADAAPDISAIQNTVESKNIIPKFSTVTAKDFSSKTTYTTLKEKLGVSGNAVLKVENDGRITYSIGQHNWGLRDLNYELSDSEAIAIAEQELDNLGLFPQGTYRTVVSKINRVKMYLSGEKRNDPETVEYTVSFYRTYNGIDVISDQEDGIMVSFNKDGLTDLRYYWRDLAFSTSNRSVANTKTTMQQAHDIYKSAIASGEYISTTKSVEAEAESAIITVAYMQIGDIVKPVWVFSTDNSYTNCIFIDMYTGELLSVD